MCVITLHEDEEGGRRPGNERKGRRQWRAGQGPRLATSVLFGSAAPRIRTRHCRAKIGSVAGPAQSAVPVVASSDLCRATMHGAAQALNRARAIGAAKSVSFKKTDRVRFKISFQKVLK